MPVEPRKERAGLSHRPGWGAGLIPQGLRDLLKGQDWILSTLGSFQAGRGDIVQFISLKDCTGSCVETGLQKKLSGNQVTIRSYCYAQERAKDGLGVGGGYGLIPNCIYLFLIAFTVTFWRQKRQDLGERLRVSLGGKDGFQDESQMTLRLMM